MDAHGKLSLVFYKVADMGIFADMGMFKDERPALIACATRPRR